MMSSHDVPPTDAKKRIALILLGGVVGVAVGLAGVYGIGRLTGNAGPDAKRPPHIVLLTTRLLPLLLLLFLVTRIHRT